MVQIGILLLTFGVAIAQGFTFDESCLVGGDAPDNFSWNVTVPFGTNAIVGSIDPATLLL
jgi:hypothetical protein